MIKRSEDWNLVYQALSANSAIKYVRNNKAEVQTVEKYSTKRFLHLLSVSLLLYTRYVQLLLLKYCKAKFIVRQKSRLNQPNSAIALPDQLGQDISKSKSCLDL